MDALLQILLALAVLAISPAWALLISQPLFWFIVAIEAIAIIPLTVRFWSEFNDQRPARRFMISTVAALFSIMLFNLLVNTVVHMGTDGT